MFVASIQSLFGMNTVPIHGVVLFCHIVVSILVYLAADKLTRSKSIAALSSGYMLLSQANAMAVLGNDTLSQVAGTLFGILSLWFLYRALTSAGPRNDLHYLVSTLCFALSLWLKETSLGFMVSLIVLSLFVRAREPGYGYGRLLVKLIPFLAVTLVYMVVHVLVVTRLAADRYDFLLGPNVLSNTFLASLSALLPISSVVTFVWYSQHHFGLLFMAVAGAAVIGGIILIGIYKSKYRKLAPILFAIAFSDLLPVIFFRHMGELYVYNATPAVALLFGIGMSGFYDTFLKGNSVRYFGFALLTLLFLSFAYADYSKGKEGVRNGIRAKVLIEEIRPYIDGVPIGGTLVLLNPSGVDPQYSIFLMSGFNVLNYGTNIINQVSGRYDFRIWIMGEGSPGLNSLPSNSLVLTIEHDHVLPAAR